MKFIFFILKDNLTIRVGSESIPWLMDSFSVASLTIKVIYSIDINHDIKNS